MFGNFKPSVLKTYKSKYRISPRITWYALCWRLLKVVKQYVSHKPSFMKMNLIYRYCEIF